MHSSGENMNFDHLLKKSKVSRCRYFVEDGDPVPCVEKISVEEVFAALQPLIKKRHQLGSIR